MQLLFSSGLGGQEGVKERKEERDKGRKRLTGEIYPEGIYSARKTHSYITNWLAGQSISQPVSYPSV